VKPQIAEQGVELVGISVDSFFAHKAFQEKLGIDTTLLSDFEPKGEVARAYGVYFDKLGFAHRALVLVDEEGRVAWAHQSESDDQIPGANVIFDALA
jgi:peroxiredoxin